MAPRSTPARAPGAASGRPGWPAARPAAGATRHRHGTGTVDVPHLFALLVDLAAESAGIIRQVTQEGTIGVQDKGGNETIAGTYVMDAQTEADRRVESTVLSALRFAFPGVHVVAEEETDGTTLVRPAERSEGERIASRELADRHPAAVRALDADWPPELRAALPLDDVVVFVDPLDGTNEYANGARECVTCLYGVAHAGRPVAGVIAQPFPEGGGEARVVWGGPRLGVHGVDVRVDGLAEPPPFKVAVNRNLRDTRQEPVLLRLRAEEAVKISATGYHFLCLLEGRAHVQLMLRKASKKWDSCAGEAVLVGAGGFVGDTVGRRYVYTAEPDGIQNLCGLVSVAQARWCDAVFDATRAVCYEQEAELGELYPYDVECPSVEV